MNGFEVGLLVAVAHELGFTRSGSEAGLSRSSFTPDPLRKRHETCVLPASLFHNGLNRNILQLIVVSPLRRQHPAAAAADAEHASPGQTP